MNIMKAKLLIVDDDHSVLESLKKLLEAECYEVYLARNANEAIENFKANRIDLVILDVNLGVDNGWKVFEQMTATNPFVPTIIITAEWGQRARAVTLGVEGLIEKPIDVPAFLEMIRDLLAENAEARQRRICGNDAYCRYVARHYEPFMKLLADQHSTPLKLSTALKAALLSLSPVGKATEHDRKSADEGDSYSDSSGTDGLYENEAIDMTQAPRSRRQFGCRQD
jgi:DNA-binding response OmpR family regulator